MILSPNAAAYLQESDCLDYLEIAYDDGADNARLRAWCADMAAIWTDGRGSGSVQREIAAFMLAHIESLRSAIFPRGDAAADAGRDAARDAVQSILSSEYACARWSFARAALHFARCDRTRMAAACERASVLASSLERRADGAC